MTTPLRALRLWSAIGWILLLAVIVLSLVKVEQPLQLAHADKYQHLLAYGTLMYWWGMVQASRRLAWMMFLPLLGLLLEWAQTLTGYRSLEWNDALANLAGVLLAAVLLLTPAGRLVTRLDAYLADRADSRGS